ncbi:MAG: 30S ribosomal protein S12 methylthiotransferase RimO [Defluviitaleaceae bacterium]|nr:30S ribosomal protein S12 methylthiotransferase RimO [Defluviitaleaceae bacterium]
MDKAKIYLVSLGCDKNRVDGEIMIGTLRGAKYEVSNDPAQADAIIINTCGFIRDAVQESIDMVLELAAYKSEGNCRALIVVGCMAERYRKEIEETIPEADAIVGVGEYEKIAGVIAKLLDITEGASQSIPSDPYLARLAARSDDAIPHVAYVKIAEGCDNHCTYCTIPSIRGAYRSRTMESIVEECKQLVSAGAKEIVLVAQDSSLYGTDIYGGEKKLAPLIREIAAKTDVKWIRLMYVYPEHITDELIKTMAELTQVCKYIDMPIQHSEGNILAQMGRKGSREALLSLINKMRKEIQGVAIRTTLMVGFPGETSEDFKNLRAFVETVKFDRMGVFPYSQEEGTPASTMQDQVDDSIKQTRMHNLMELQQDIHFEKQREYIGQVLDVIVDEAIEGEYIGRTQYDAYEVDAVVHFIPLDKKLSLGEIVQVRIIETEGYDLRGALA